MLCRHVECFACIGIATKTPPWSSSPSCEPVPSHSSRFSIRQQIQATIAPSHLSAAVHPCRLLPSLTRSLSLRCALSLSSRSSATGVGRVFGCILMV